MSAGCGKGMFSNTLFHSSFWARTGGGRAVLGPRHPFMLRNLSGVWALGFGVSTLYASRTLIRAAVGGATYSCKACG